MSPPPGPLLQVDRLSLGFSGRAGFVQVLADVSLTIYRREILALVGESGCGKSLTGLAILDLLPDGAVSVGGEIRFAAGRRRRAAMVFQEPASALNPVLTLGFQIGEALRLHRGLRGRAAHRAARELLDRVAMPDPEARLGSYSHELSGGQRQRAMIALALAGEPDLLIADEPTTALDVTVQAQIVELLGRLASELELAILLITHDLGIVAQLCDRVLVMYAGEIVEEAPVELLFSAPAHPYTRALLGAVPRLGDGGRSDGGSRGIPGQVPEPGAWPVGCRFHPRCAEALEDCGRRSPDLEPLAAERHVRCWLHGPAGGADGVSP